VPGAQFSLPKHILSLWKAAAELRVAASDEPDNAAALRRIANELEAQADELEKTKRPPKEVGFA